MKCNNCPALWVQGGGGYEYPNEVDCWGCAIKGIYYGGEDDSCNLTKQQVENRLQEWDDYINGKIKRPKWVVNKFIHDMDDACTFSGEPSLHLPWYPTSWHSEKKNYHLYGRIDMSDAKKYAVRDFVESAIEELQKNIPCHDKNNMDYNHAYAEGVKDSITIIERCLEEFE